MSRSVIYRARSLARSLSISLSLSLSVVVFVVAQTLFSLSVGAVAENMDMYTLSLVT